LSPETLHLYLTPTAVLALSRVGWRRRLGQTRTYPVIAASRGEPWQDLLDAVALALRDFHCRRVRVVLSHHFVQYQVLAWRKDLVGDAEYLALAKLEFTAAFGNLADAWTIALSDERPGVPRLASAIATALLEGLNQAAAKAGVKLVAVQPYLTVAARLWLRRLSGKQCQWLVLHEPGRLSLVVRQAGAWCWVRHLRVADDWSVKIEQLLHAESQLCGLAVTPAQVHVFAPSAGTDVWHALGKSGYQVIEPTSQGGFINQTHGAFAPAWLA
jgi:hypothetical protein